MKPQRIQLKRVKGSKMPPNTISVARPSAWGNPYAVGRTYFKTGELIADRAQAVRLFLAHILPEGKLQPEDIDELRGKNLACYCPIGEPCHADVLLKLANESEC